MKNQQTHNNMKTKINRTRKRSGGVKSNPEIDRARQQAIERGYQKLAAGIVVQAVADYRLYEKCRLVSGGLITPEGMRSPFRRDILDLMAFLRGRGLRLCLEAGVFSPEQEQALRELGFEIYMVPRSPEQPASAGA
jgi:hypothetical protein